MAALSDRGVEECVHLKEGGGEEEVCWPQERVTERSTCATCEVRNGVMMGGSVNWRGGERERERERVSEEEEVGYSY